MISNQQVLQLIHGCVESKEIGEYIAFYHCNSYQIKHTEFDDFLHVRAPFSTSVTLEFYTDATKFGFDVKKVYIGSNDTFDLYIDNVAFEFRELETIADEDSVEFTLPAGNKRILLYFPNDSELDYHNLKGVHNGSEAMTLFPKIKDMPVEEQKIARKNLLKYCELDTFAMVKVWQELVRVANE